MKLLEGGRVYLDAGEVMPAFCGCGEVYQPAAASYSSECPKCHVRNIHTENVQWEALS